MSDVAVVLMAYGSPDRLEDVPAYYEDIRGGRPIRPELLENLVERYRRLGIEDANPLNAITEETRAALAHELGVPVFTGMKHWQPRIAAATEAALATGASTIVGLVLAPHYSRGSIAGYRSQVEKALEDGGPELVFVESWHDDPGLVSLLADRVRGTSAHVVFTAHSLPARVLEGGDPYEEQLLETSRIVAEAADIADWSFSYQSESATGEPWLQPDILDHLHGAAGQGRRRRARLPRGLRRPTTSRSGGTSTWKQPSARPSSACATSGSRCRTPTRPSSARSRASSGARRRYRQAHDAPRLHRDRPREPLLPRLPAVGANAEGAARRAAARPRDRRLGAPRRVGEHRARRGRRPDRPQRLREDDAAPARRRASSSRRQAPSRWKGASARCSSSAPASTPSSRAARTSISTAQSLA